MIKNPLVHLVGLLLILVLIGGGALYSSRDTILGAQLPSGTAVFETSLASRMTTTDTSMTIVSARLREGGSLSGYQCFTVDEGKTEAEYICGTLSGTTVTALERGISPSTGTSTVSALKFSHRVGASVKITDFPLIQRMRSILSGTDPIPSLIYATSTALITAGSPTTTLATKYYVDSVAVAGASDANTVTKGIVELATASEAASSTATGGTGANLVIAASTATDTPNTASRATRVLMSDMTGYLKQTWLNLTESFTPSGTWNFLSNVGIGTSTPYASLSIAGHTGVVANIFTATSTSATSTLQNLRVPLNASTTNLWVSGTCVGCLSGYERLTNTGAGPTAAGTVTTVTSDCSANKKIVGGGGSLSTNDSGELWIGQSYASDEDTWSVITYCYIPGGGCAANTVTAYALCVNR